MATRSALNKIIGSQHDHRALKTARVPFRDDEDGHHGRLDVRCLGMSLSVEMISGLLFLQPGWETQTVGRNLEQRKKQGEKGTSLTGSHEEVGCQIRKVWPYLRCRLIIDDNT
jgi:hypothetical protein